jgi:acetylornithine deacetylase/succinyl-diaminopimelate desuccinylase-like protein
MRRIMDMSRCVKLVDETWDASIVPQLIEYIRIPNQSPHFDPEWAAAGHMDKAVDLVSAWCSDQDIPGLTIDVVRLPERTPVILMEIPGTVDDTVLLYGHLDKQPPMDGWEEGLGPWTPVLRDGRLYGRGGADDGYAAFASLTAIRAVLDQGLPHARMVVLIEACEESGSEDLPAYIEALEERIGTPSLVVCLDSGCGNYDQLWCTTSLRGMAMGVLSVDVLTEGVHSGDASGIVPDSFRVLRTLLSRLEDEKSGEITLGELHADVPDQRREQAAVAAGQLGGAVESKFPFVKGVRPLRSESTELVLQRTWAPTLVVTGQEGLPSLTNAGNVLRPRTRLKLSFRLPPTCDSARASARIKEVLEADPPHGARVSFEAEEACDGWDAPPLADWLGTAITTASQDVFGRPACFMGEGGSIPFMGMLGERFPDAQFMITGVLGPKSNAHGPNEFLDIATGKRLTACVAQVLVEHATRQQSHTS